MPTSMKELPNQLIKFLHVNYGTPGKAFMRGVFMFLASKIAMKKTKRIYW